MSTPSVSVVVCAYTLERWNEIVASVLSAARQEPAPGELLLVVDHNPALVERAERELVAQVPTLRVLASERKKGLSGARNTALTAARGRVVVFLDDDAAAQDGWLAALLWGYQDPVVVAVGGSATPVWPDGCDRPVTLPAAKGSGRGALDWVVGCTYDGQPEVTGPVRNLMGCNMSVLRDVAIGVGGFSEDLGRVGKTPLGAEETELCIRITEADPSAVIVFEPAARVRHHVSPDRMTWSYLLRRSYAEGLSKATVAATVGQDAALSTERGYVVHILPRAFARGLGGAVAPGSGSRWASALGSVAVVGALAWTAGGYARGRVARLTGRAPGRSRQGLTGVCGGPA